MSSNAGKANCARSPCTKKMPYPGKLGDDGLDAYQGGCLGTRAVRLTQELNLNAIRVMAGGESGPEATCFSAATLPPPPTSGLGSQTLPARSVGISAVEKGREFEPPHFEPLNWGGMAPHSLLERVEFAARLFCACYLPVISLLSANYLPVMVLFCARRVFLINHLKTNVFRRIIEARTAPEQGEKGG